MSIGFNGSVAGEGILNVDGVPKLKLDAATPLLLASELYKGIAGPAFLANRSGADQPLTTNVALKAVMGAELFDNTNTYDAALSRWTPGVPGLYLLGGGLSLSHPGQSPTSIISVYKNGAEFKRLDQIVGANGANPNGITALTLSATDYVEMWAIEAGSAGSILSELLVGRFFGCFLRS